MNKEQKTRIRNRRMFLMTHAVDVVHEATSMYNEAEAYRFVAMLTDSEVESLFRGVQAEELMIIYSGDHFEIEELHG